MKTVIIHGQSHQGSTCAIARSLAQKLGGEVTEFFLPRDFGAFCVGCGNCFKISEEKCPHHQALVPITAAMDAADVIILASPVYVYHATGAMKTFFDHYGYRWLVHSPEPSMFHKQGVCISTAAGAGMKSANKDMADSLFFWGVARIYRLGFAVAAMDWNHVSAKKKGNIEKKTSALARKIAAGCGRAKPGLKMRLWFALIRLFMKKGWNERDVAYWRRHGWLEKEKPWN